MCLRMWMREHRQKHEHLQDTLIALLLGAQTGTVQSPLEEATECIQGAILNPGTAHVVIYIFNIATIINHPDVGHITHAEVTTRVLK